VLPGSVLEAAPAAFSFTFVPLHPAQPAAPFDLEQQ
jgi:hypothetical protein